MLRLRCNPVNLVRFLWSPRFLKILAILVIVLVLTGVCLAAWLCSPDVADVTPLEVEETSYNGTIAIVGGGSAGMFAAYTLDYIGANYVLLEASTDVGGRAQEMDGFADVPLDLGPEWIHVDPKVRQDLLLYDDVVTDRTISYQPQSLRVYWGQKERRFNFVHYFYREFKFYNTTWHSYLKNYVYPYIANRTHTKAVVDTIDYSQPDRIKISLKDERVIYADRVIMATPVTILQQKDITFIPEFPTEKQKAIDAVYMPAGLKAWIEFDTRFYPDQLTIMSGDDKEYFDAVFRKPSKRNILALFEVSDSAYDRVELTDDQIFKSIMGELDRIFDGKASAHYIQHHIQNWSAKPYIKGSYSYNSYDIGPILEPVDGRIYFCGEYLEKANQATVHGAGMSGRRVAQQVILDAEKSSSS